mgnify:CR=1 FL=1
MHLLHFQGKRKNFIGSNFPCIVNIIRSEDTTYGIVKTYGEIAQNRLKPCFHRAGLKYPPHRLIFLVMKSNYELQLYAINNPNTNPIFIRSYPILAKSGKLGPK